jgi:DNA-binding LacI/PurR family transcriptional regulator
MAGRRVTIDEVASASNASAATVSLALRNKPGVSRETRERILAAAQSLGYQRTIRAGRDEADALLNVALVFRTWTYGAERRSPALNPFYSWVLTGIQESGPDAAMNLLLGTIPVDDENSPIEMPSAMLRQPLDGVLMVGAHRAETIEQVLDLLGNPAAPMVLVDSEDSGHHLDHVISDNTGGAYLATTHLIENGHRRIGYLGAPSAWDRNFAHRLDGFRAALADHGLEPVSEVELALSDDYEAGLTKALSSTTATFGANDDIALALARVAQAKGIRIPEDHSIIGYDDTLPARDANPPLTTMAVDKLALGRLAVQALEYRIRWPESAPLRIITQPQLVERDSVARDTDESAEAAS